MSDESTNDGAAEIIRQLQDGRSGLRKSLKDNPEALADMCQRYGIEVPSPGTAKKKATPGHRKAAGSVRKSGTSFN